VLAQRGAPDTITFVLNAALTALAAILIAPVYLVKYDIGGASGSRPSTRRSSAASTRSAGRSSAGSWSGCRELSAAYISSHFRDPRPCPSSSRCCCSKPEGIWGVKENGRSGAPAAGPHGALALGLLLPLVLDQVKALRAEPDAGLRDLGHRVSTCPRLSPVRSRSATRPSMASAPTRAILGPHGVSLRGGLVSGWCSRSAGAWCSGSGPQ